MKVANEEITMGMLECKTTIGKPKQKWVQFCEYFLSRGYTLMLYEARRTVSKYITLTHEDHPGKSYKVRFSNHKPNRYKEQTGDCDFFVGRTHFGVKTTRDAAIAARMHFNDMRLVKDSNK